MTNIRNLEQFVSAQWDWTPFNDCFVTASGKHTKIRISDIDGHAERNGHFFWIETTRRANGAITTGQMRSVIHRVARGDMAVIIFGKPNLPEGMHVYRPHTLQPAKITPCGVNEIWRVIRCWFLWADINGVMEIEKANEDAAISF